MTELLDESYDRGVESEQVRIVELIDKRIEDFKKCIDDKMKAIGKHFIKGHNIANWKESKGTRRAMIYVNGQIKSLDKEIEALQEIKKAIEEKE